GGRHERPRPEIARRGQVHVAVEIVRYRMLSLVPAESFDPRVAIVDTPHTESVRWGVRLELMFRKSQKRRLPRVRPLSCRRCDRQTSVVADIRPGNALQPVFVVNRIPIPDEIDLR